MKRILVLLFLFSYSAFSQTVYQPHEVEKQAEPVGGFLMLNQFIASNLQVPFPSSIKGIKGKVFVKGIVEADGSMSDLQIARGIDSLSDKECIRVLKLFKAWQPASLNDKSVRQAVVYPVTVSAAPQTNYDSTRTSLVNYFTEKSILTNNEAQYRYRSILPIDDRGYIKANIIYEELQNNKWKQLFVIPFKRMDLWYKLRGTSDSIQAYQLSAEDKNQMVQYVPILTFQQNGTLLEYGEVSPSLKPMLEKYYYQTGMLQEIKTFGDSTSIDVRYYDNGQIKSVVENLANAFEGTNEKGIISYWQRNGEQNVKDGNGYLKLVGKIDSDNILVEEGRVALGARDGKWTGRHADSTLYCEEFYEKGKFKKGVIYANGEKVVYENKVVQPVFKGGISAFYQFISQNMRYPENAARSGVTGKVFLSFVVCEDGSLCDYEIVKGVRADLNDEALRVVKKMSGKWQPGVFRGQKVRVKYNLPINFALK